MAGRTGAAASVTEDEVCDTWFLHGATRWGRNPCYLASDVDDLLRRIAAEFSARRPAGPLIKNTAFRRGKGAKGYDIDAVDWFLDQLLSQDSLEPARTSADPWHDVGDVAQLVRGGVSVLAQRYPGSKPTQKQALAWFAERCQTAWRGFGQQPGAQLWWGKVGPALLELRTAEQQTLVSLQGVSLQRWGPNQGGGPKTVSVGVRSFSYKRAAVRLRSTANSWPPGVADIAARSWRDSAGHFTPGTMSSGEQRAHARRVYELVDNTGSPILYRSGWNSDRRARVCVTFPDGRWLRFLVRGTQDANAIMTAVDQAGNKVARYRFVGRGGNLNSLVLNSLRQSAQDAPVGITVNPGWALTDELTLALALSAGQLSAYFEVPRRI